MKRDTDITHTSNKINKIKRTSSRENGHKTKTIPVLHNKIGYVDIERTFGLTDQRLNDIFSSRDYVSTESINKLARHKFKHLVVSLYLTITPEDTLRDEKIYLTVFNSLMREQMDLKKDEIDKLSTEDKEILREDINEIQAFLINLPNIIDTKIKSLIIFKSNGQLNFVVNMLRPLHSRNIFVIDHSPYTMPLLEILEEETKVLIVSISKDQTNFYGYLLGRIGYIGKLNFPGGYQQVNVKAERSAGKVQDYLQTQLNYYFKDITGEVSRMIGKEYESLVFTGDEPLVKRFQDHLSKETTNKTLGFIPLNPENSIFDIRDDISDLISKHEAEREFAEIERLAEAAGKNQAAIGIDSVIKAQNRFLTRDIFINPSNIINGYRCTDHDYLSLEKKKCRFCEKELVPVRNIIEDLIEIGNAYKVNTHVISHGNDELDKYDGVAAIIYEKNAE